MMHEVAELDEADFEGRGSRARRSYYGLLGWNAVHILIAVAAAGVAAGTTHWIGELEARIFSPAPPSYSEARRRRPLLTRGRILSLPPAQTRAPRDCSASTTRGCGPSATRTSRTTRPSTT